MSSTIQKKKEANLRKKRSAVKSTLTKLRPRVIELEGNREHEDTTEAATLVLEKIRILQQEYKTHHEGIFDFIDAEDEDGLECESEILYQQEKYNDKLLLRLKRLISERGSQIQGNTKAIDRKLKDIEETLIETKRSLMINWKIYLPFNSILKSSSSATTNLEVQGICSSCGILVMTMSWQRIMLS